MPVHHIHSAKPCWSRRRPRVALPVSLAISLAFASTLARAEQGTIISDGVTLQFVDEGEGETIVFLHGFGGSLDMWSRIGLLPLDGFRTIAFDARGHGQSDKPEHINAFGPAMIEDVVALMEARGVGSAHVVGYSMGAETALALAVTHPDRVASLVVAGSGWSREDEAQAYGYFSHALAEAETFGSFMAAMAPPDQKMSPEAQRAMATLLTAHGIDPAQPAAPLAEIAAALPEIISLEASQLATISVPVLGVAGAQDPEHDNVAQLGEVLSDFTFVSIAGADHLMAPVSAEFTTAVTGFLND